MLNRALIALIFSVSYSCPSFAVEKKKCVCTCVVKDEERENKYGTLTGQGVDRQGAGEDLKKKLGKKKCEISPDCEGSC